MSPCVPQSSALSLHDVRLDLPRVTDPGEVADPVAASASFLEEVNNATAALLDTVIRDVIIGGGGTANEISRALNQSQESPLPAPQPEINAEHQELLREAAGDFVQDLIEVVSEPVETAEMEETAKSFLDRVLDKIEDDCDPVRNLDVEAFLESVCDQVMEMTVMKFSKLDHSSDPITVHHGHHAGIMHEESKKSLSLYIPIGRSKTGKKASKKPAVRAKKTVQVNKSDVATSREFDEMISNLSSCIVSEALALYNPLFAFHSPAKFGSELDGENVLNDITISDTCVEDSSLMTEETEVSLELLTSRCSVETREEPPQVCSEPSEISCRKVFDTQRWLCISRPQYKFSCGISAVVSCFNYLYSTLGHGDLPPAVSQEAAMELLAFSPPYEDIPFGPFTGNATLKKWFNRLTAHFKVRGYFYFLYKPKGRLNRTSIDSDTALEELKRGLMSKDTTFIYHCWNHYMCPIGFEETPEAPTRAYSGDTRGVEMTDWILIGDTSRKHASIHCKSWTDIVTDLNCESPDHFNIRKSHEGVFTADKSNPKRAGGNLHCIMALKKLKPKSVDKEM